MNILCIGDVCGHLGCEHLAAVLPAIKREHKIDFVIANGENSADGNGIIPHSARMLFDAGVDAVTGGNHTFRRREIFDMLESEERLIRPANMPASAPGHGYSLFDCGRTSIGIINILGTTYMESLDCPFRTALLLAEKLKNNGAKIIIVDFHAEATSEKRAMGFWLDGKVSAVFGTHTHVQTSVEQILPQGTGYITDLGMTGPVESVLGVKPEIIILKFVDKISSRFEQAEGECALEGCVFTVDDKSGLCFGAKRIRI